MSTIEMCIVFGTLIVVILSVMYENAKKSNKITQDLLIKISQQLDYIAKKGPTEARPKVEEKR